MGRKLQMWVGSDPLEADDGVDGREVHPSLFELALEVRDGILDSLPLGTERVDNLRVGHAPLWLMRRT